MSVAKYAYEAWKCDGEFCVGDCSICYKADIEQDGDVTWKGFTDGSDSESRRRKATDNASTNTDN